MRTLAVCLPLIVLMACSESETPPPAVEPAQPEVAIANDIEDAVPADPEQVAKLEASLLASMQKLSAQQAQVTEEVSVNELETLSESDREALQEISAQQTMGAAEQKALEQAENTEQSKVLEQ